MPKQAKLFLAVLVPLAILLAPSGWIPIDNLTAVEQRVIALFFLAAIFWVLEPIPVYATSILVIVLELLLVSDKAFILFQGDTADPSFGTPVKYNEIMGAFASPIIMLFLGGFFLAMAVTKFRLDVNLARVLLRPFGRDPKMILLGLMIITAVFSMFMSNTATTAMMLAILSPVFAAFDEDDIGRVAFALAIPFAANVGGIGTPIGTPPNAIALKYLTGEDYIGFGTWMAFAVPFVAVMLLFSWLLLLFLFPPRAKQIELKIKGEFQTNWKALTVCATFAGTVLLWLLDAFHGMNSYVVALIPVAVFTVTQIINKEDLKRVSWDVLWLVSGGIALGVGLDRTGLSQHLIESIPFGNFSPVMICLLFAGVTFAMANFMSHTATANLILPLVAALGGAVASLEPLGGGKMLILAVTFTSSLSMSLAVSTPPNAIAYSTGVIKGSDMLKTGLTIGLVGLAATFGLMAILNQIGFFPASAGG